MVEFITILIISTIIGACSLGMAGIGVWVTVSNTFRMREIEEKQKEKAKKQKSLYERKYTSTAKTEDYLKIAMLMHLGKADNKKTTFLKFQGQKGMMYLEVTLRNCDFKYKPSRTFYQCSAYLDPTDNSIYASFDKEKARQRWDQYLETLKLEDLEQKYWDAKQVEDMDVESESVEETKKRR